MTIQSSGQLAMSDIHNEFGRGYDLNAYRGVPWWMDNGDSGYFSSGQISMYEFYGKRAAPLALAIGYHGAASSANAGGNLSGNFDIGADNPNRYVVVAAMSADSNSPVPQSCTVAGVSATRVVLRTSANALALFITPVPIASGAVVNVNVGWSGSSVSNRVIGVYTLVGKLNPSPAATFVVNGGSGDTIYVPAGGAIITAITYRNSTAAINISGASISEQGIVAGSHRWGWAHYSASSAENHTITISPTGGMACASWGFA